MNFLTTIGCIEKVYNWLINLNEHTYIITCRVWVPQGSPRHAAKWKENARVPRSLKPRSYLLYELSIASTVFNALSEINHLQLHPSRRWFNVQHTLPTPNPFRAFRTSSWLVINRYESTDQVLPLDISWIVPTAGRPRVLSCVVRRDWHFDARVKPFATFRGQIRVVREMS